MAVDPATSLISLWMFCKGVFWALSAAVYSVSCRDRVPCRSKQEYFQAISKFDQK